MMLSLPQRNVLILAIAALAAIASPSVAMTPAEVAEIYKKYDVDEENTPECLEAHEDFLCPKDQNIPCSDIKLIEEWCSNAIGADEVAASKGAEKGSGKNALEGCVKYIGFHVLDLDHMACCESEVCEDWIEQQFEMMGFGEDEDFEDFDGEGYYGDGSFEGMEDDDYAEPDF